MTNRVLIIGHSHVECLRAAAADAVGHDIEVVNLRHEATTADGDVDYAAIRLRNPDLLALYPGGNAHNVWALVEHPQPYSAGTVGSGPGRQAIPRQVLRAALQAHMRPQLESARAVRDRYPDAAAVLICAPPPKGDLDQVRANPRFFRDKLDRGFAPDTLRLAVYGLQNEIHRDLAATMDIPLILPSDTALDENGLLAASYGKIDPTHGNDAYGALMLAQILQHVPEPA